MKRNIFSVFIVLAVLFLPFFVSAHQPRIVENELVKVQNPEVSQAFYGELKNHPQYFEIDSDKKFNLYVGVLMPDVSGIKTDISAEVIKVGENNREVIGVLDGVKFSWKRFYEPFAGDHYFQGPEFFTPAEPGKYLVMVSSPDFLGKYTLVIGQQESFSFGETWRTLQILPGLKKDFFGRSPLTMFFNYIGLGILVILIIIAAAIFLTIKIIKNRNFRKKQELIQH